MIEAPHSTDIDVYLRQPCYLAPSKLTKAPMYYWSASDRTQNAHRICNQSGTCGLCGLWNQQLADYKARGMVQLRPWPPHTSQSALSPLLYSGLHYQESRRFPSRMKFGVGSATSQLLNEFPMLRITL